MKKIEKKNRVNMDTMFHVVITLKNGCHQTLRVARWIVARIVYQFREYKNDIFKRHAEIDIYGEIVVLNNVEKMKIVYEKDGVEYLTLA